MILVIDFIVRISNPFNLFVFIHSFNPLDYNLMNLNSSVFMMNFISYDFMMNFISFDFMMNFISYDFMKN